MDGASHANDDAPRYFVYEADGTTKKFLETPPDDGITTYYALSSNGQICSFAYESDEELPDDDEEPPEDEIVEDEIVEFYYFDENDVQIDLESVPDGSFSYYIFRSNDQTYWYFDHTTGEISNVNGESDPNSAPAPEPDANPTPPPAPAMDARLPALDTKDCKVSTSTLNPQVAEFVPGGFETPKAPTCPCGGEHGIDKIVHGFMQQSKQDGTRKCECCCKWCYKCDCCKTAPFHYRCIKCL